MRKCVEGDGAAHVVADFASRSLSAACLVANPNRGSTGRREAD